MTKQWLFQFEDGIWCSDGVGDDNTSLVLSELRSLLDAVPRLSTTIYGHRTFDLTLSKRRVPFKAGCDLFERVWKRPLHSTYYETRRSDISQLSVTSFTDQES